MSDNGRVYNVPCIYKSDETSYVRMALKVDERILEHPGGLKPEQIPPMTKKLVCLEICNSHHCGYKWHEGEDV